MNRSLRTALGAALLGTTVLGTAHNASAATTDDAAWKAAGTVCQSVTDDTTYEACVIGYVMNATDRALTSDDYHATGNGLAPDHATRALTSKVAKPTRSDKARLKVANAECVSVPNHTVKWSACVTGSLAASSGDARFLTSADWFAIRVRQHKGYTWEAYAKHASRTLVG